MAKIFIGNVSSRTRERDLERLCEKYGDLRSFSLNRNGFAFVEFEDHYDAEDAIRAIDGRDLDGRDLTCEKARGRGRSDVGTGQVGGRVRGSKEFCIRVEGIGSRTTWKELKDFARKSGRVEYADIWNEGSRKYGIIKYDNYGDFKDALDNLDDTKLDGSYVRLTKEGGGRSRSRSRSSSRSRSRGRRSKRSRSRSRSPRRSRSRSRGGKKSRSRSKDRSDNKSRSRSKSGDKKEDKKEDKKDDKKEDKKDKSRSKSR
jgi:arginine/serine-rich splicing factor 4/5/6